MTCGGECEGKAAASADEVGIVGGGSGEEGLGEDLVDHPASEVGDVGLGEVDGLVRRVVVRELAAEHPAVAPVLLQRNVRPVHQLE